MSSKLSEFSRWEWSEWSNRGRHPVSIDQDDLRRLWAANQHTLQAMLVPEPSALSSGAVQRSASLRLESTKRFMALYSDVVGVFAGIRVPHERDVIGLLLLWAAEVSATVCAKKVLGQHLMGLPADHMNPGAGAASPTASREDRLAAAGYDFQSMAKKYIGAFNYINRWIQRRNDHENKPTPTLSQVFTGVWEKQRELAQRSPLNDKIIQVRFLEAGDWHPTLHAVAFSYITNMIFSTLLLGLTRLEDAQVLPLAHHAMLEEMFGCWNMVDDPWASGEPQPAAEAD